ncbi:hypothetical protein POPTR_001G448300v4 [Populus trichocarpa]|jgi:glutaredoxin domain-containing cysteine-rich protein 1|uniref:Glutaredoxin domain-containing protein n=1 Tax=Populus trichocarpa TaxID=3694 RepID=B9GIS6_POPTR|nr:uncharacterized protein At5g39865 [Populus trichocarpa]PNT60024.1 hypothetical protein POPTR_001G448300v4 [Populus trichocarpa]|eukprot:XP_002298963.2 uncharacterized protein At5g39865 [Populus trichocarpa]
MGCVSSNLLNNEDEFAQLGSSALSHHIVSLTSTTYGLLNLDPLPPPTPPPQTTTTPPTPSHRFTLGSIFPTPLTEPKSKPEIIDSWELMSGLDTDSFRFSPIIKKDQESSHFSSFFKKHQETPLFSKENTSPKLLLKDSSLVTKKCQESPLSSQENKNPNFLLKDSTGLIDKFERLCPPSGEDRVVIYTTTLRGIRKTFEACNVVRAAFEGFGVLICERDVSMDKGFKEELMELMRGKEREAMVPPRVFVKGRYMGGAEEVMRLVEEGIMGDVLEGLPKKGVKGVCEGCGDVRFLPCFSCNGSCKMVMVVKEELGQKQGRTVVLRCPDCNENGLVLCPICS